MRNLFVIMSLTFFMIACTKAVMPTATESDAQRAVKKWPDASLNELAQGKLLYEQHCNKCHGLKMPDSRDEAAWNHIVPEMAQKAKIDAKTENLILRYVVTMSASASQK